MSASIFLILLAICLLYGEQVAGDQEQEHQLVLPLLSDSSQLGDAQLMFPAESDNWMVENCLAVKMVAKMMLYPNNSNIVVTKNIPALAKVSPTSSCSYVNSTTTQVLTLEWSEADPSSGILSRNLSLYFYLNNTIPPMYTVSMVTSMYQLSRNKVLGKMSPGRNTTDLESRSDSNFIRMTTTIMNPLQFMVPKNRSFLCEESLTVEMMAELITTDGTPDEKLQKAMLTISSFQFDAFRPTTLSTILPSPQFQAATSCSSPSASDLVPIVVGCSLAGLVFFIMIGYLVGRRKVEVKGCATVIEQGEVQ
eukprot:GFUD01044270.1.p1 GENE.GFUD01044270.1~~GFUD01044270.1.p1  ORF type:complete len:323 (-),score=85.30 GFUD01044270.1:95-1018(-)